MLIFRLLICVGYEMVEWHPDRWNSVYKKQSSHMDVLTSEVDKNYLPDVELVGEITGIIKQK